jgi:hypothetical protein
LAELRHGSGIKASRGGVAHLIDGSREEFRGTKVSRFLRAELKRAGTGYKDLAERLNKQEMSETETSIIGKLARGTCAVSFFLAVLTPGFAVSRYIWVCRDAVSC